MGLCKDKQKSHTLVVIDLKGGLSAADYVEVVEASGWYETSTFHIETRPYKVDAALLELFDQVVVIWNGLTPYGEKVVNLLQQKKKPYYVKVIKPPKTISGGGVLDTYRPILQIKGVS